jgi:hypothetical protein
LSRAARAAHLFVAALAIIGIALGYSGMASTHPSSELWWRTVRFWSYFTNLSNAMVALAGIGCALPGGALHHWAVRPGTRTAIAVYILIVGVIFRLLLQGTSQHGWSNLFVHQLVPTGWLLCWLVFAPHGTTPRHAPLRWLVFPLAYAGWTIAHGLASGWYPYYFIDAAKLGWPRTLAHMATFTALFAALGWLFRWADERLGRRDKGDRPTA